MARCVATITLFGFLLQSAIAVPVPGLEECVCQPIDPIPASQISGNHTSAALESCNQVAQRIEHWRALSFHRPELADIFEGNDAGFIAHTKHPRSEKRRKHKKADDSKDFSQKLKDAFFRARHGGAHKRHGCHHSRVSAGLPGAPEAAPLRRPSPQQQRLEAANKSTGVVAAPPLHVPGTPQRYKILCRARYPASEAWVPGQVGLLIVACLVMTAIWLSIFDGFLQIWARLWQIPDPDEGTIVLPGREKRMYAFLQEYDEVEFLVIPAAEEKD
ncbi:hypothetical protein EJ06DRAFT_558934 [Trichodelitschia bisporula]|uniref:Uncharacterized protein n=1 Tax=Trichodelitschia bisporula TaxID=703511 RepID=A0A6G1HN83_9PEZI|nr:hypothetical protein EJ06DRAFT_558934 [Trichodelitschia bisporula]